MKNRAIPKVKRPSMKEEYRQSIVMYIVANHGYDQVSAEAKADEIIASKFKDRQIKAITKQPNGQREVKYTPLSGYLASCSNKIISPSGSIYTPAEEKEAFVVGMVKDRVKMRDETKKRMFAAKEVGDKVTADREKLSQATQKIILNSLPGAMGSPWNLFFDKGGYNAITSFARALIAHSYVTAENLLGGNFAWFDEDEAINHLILTKKVCPPSEEIFKVMNKYGIFMPSRDNLYEFMHTTIKKYTFAHEHVRLKKFIQSMTDDHVAFTYYYLNLRHLFWNNNKRDLVKDLLYVNRENVPNYDPSELKKQCHDLMGVVYTILAGDIGNIKTSKIVDHKELCNLVIHTAKTLQQKLDQLEELMDVFIYVDAVTPNILTRNRMYRNTVVVSDTDSVIFTSKDWVEWYVGDVDKLVPDSYAIAALATYWLTLINADAMAKFSRDSGATGDNTFVMVMKNEFLYPTFLLYEVKKVYAGMIKVQEGVVLPEAQPDIKGAALRSSNVPKDAREFTENLIVNDILTPCMEGQVSSIELIRKVLTFEHSIIADIEKGGISYLSRESVKTPDEYNNPNSGMALHIRVWNDLFKPDYGELLPPDKVPMIHTKRPDAEYLEWLKGENPTVHEKMVALMEEMGKKFPDRFVLNNRVRSIPKELIPLLNVREIVFPIMKPIYITLERIHVTIGHKDENVLLSDIYYM